MSDDDKDLVLGGEDDELEPGELLEDEDFELGDDDLTEGDE